MRSGKESFARAVKNRGNIYSYAHTRHTDTHARNTTDTRAHTYVDDFHLEIFGRSHRIADVISKGTRYAAGDATKSHQSREMRRVGPASGRTRARATTRAGITAAAARLESAAHDDDATTLRHLLIPH